MFMIMSCCLLWRKGPFDALSHACTCKIVFFCGGGAIQLDEIRTRELRPDDQRVNFFIEAQLQLVNEKFGLIYKLVNCNLIPIKSVRLSLRIGARQSEGGINKTTS